MKSITKKLLIGVVSLSLIAPVSFVPSHFASNINVSAKARVHHHKKIRKRRVRRRRNVKRRRVRRTRHSNNRVVSLIKPTSISGQMAYQTLNDINKDRRSHGIAAVSETRPLNRLANRRAHQLVHNFSHYDNRGRTYYQVDAKRMGINLAHYYHNYTTDGENIANAGMDHGDVDGTYMPNDPKEYDNHNGYDMANMDNDAMFRYDSGSGWGHRRNILNKHFRNVGIGVAHKGTQYYMAEDFDS